jgi:CheY-like chemotaxis protein
MGLILVVDDHTDTRNFMAKLLKQWGYRALEAETGEAALALLAGEDKPDLVIVDGMMPGMNGAEFIRLMRADEKTSTIPAILYTAICDHAFTDNALEKGASEIWIKLVIKPEQIRERVGHYVK